MGKPWAGSGLTAISLEPKQTFAYDPKVVNFTASVLLMLFLLDAQAVKRDELCWRDFTFCATWDQMGG